MPAGLNNVVSLYSKIYILKSENDWNIIVSIISLIFIALCGIILSGKGDNLIAGYKTATERERQQYDIKRLRFVVALMCLLPPLLVCWIPFLTENILIVMFIPILCVILIYSGILIINSWCKKK